MALRRRPGHLERGTHAAATRPLSRDLPFLFSENNATCASRALFRFYFSDGTLPRPTQPHPCCCCPHLAAPPPALLFVPFALSGKPGMRAYRPHPLHSKRLSHRPVRYRFRCNRGDRWGEEESLPWTREAAAPSPEPPQQFGGDTKRDERRPFFLRTVLWAESLSVDHGVEHRTSEVVVFCLPHHPDDCSRAVPPLFSARAAILG